jgi:hypothetical protein
MREVIRNGIEAALRKRAAPQQPLRRQHEAPPRAMPGHRFNGVIRARRIKLARSPENRRKKDNVEAQKSEKQPRAHGPPRRPDVRGQDDVIFTGLTILASRKFDAPERLSRETVSSTPTVCVEFDDFHDELRSNPVWSEVFSRRGSSLSNSSASAAKLDVATELRG